MLTMEVSFSLASSVLFTRFLSIIAMISQMAAHSIAEPRAIASLKNLKSFFVKVEESSAGASA